MLSLFVRCLLHACTPSNLVACFLVGTDFRMEVFNFKSNHSSISFGWFWKSLQRIPPNGYFLLLTEVLTPVRYGMIRQKVISESLDDDGQTTAFRSAFFEVSCQARKHHRPPTRGYSRTHQPFSKNLWPSERRPNLSSPWLRSSKNCRFCLLFGPCVCTTHTQKSPGVLMCIFYGTTSHTSHFPRLKYSIIVQLWTNSASSSPHHR